MRGSQTQLVGVGGTQTVATGPFRENEEKES